MNSQQLLWIIVTVGVFLVFLFLSLKWERKKPTQLNLRAGEDNKEEIKDIKTTMLDQITNKSEASVASSSSQFSKPFSKPNRDYSKWSTPESLIPPKAPVAEDDDGRHGAAQSARPLTVVFMYNGHDWEAFQVLGVLPGTTLPLVTETYQNLLKNSDSSSHSFFEAAYMAILHAYRDRRL